MNIEKNFAVAAAFTLSFALTHAVAGQPDDPSARTMRPMQGTDVEIGGDRGVTYFVREDGRCKLVMTLAAEPGADASSFTATRFEATIEGGDTTRYVADDGAAIDFDCEPSAQTVSIRPVEMPAGAVAVR